MGNKPTNPSKIVMDPMFHAPPGGEENFTSTSPAAIRSLGDTGQASTGIPFQPPVEITGEQPQTYLETPDTFFVVDQTLRIGPGGQQVVDIVIDCEEIIGALEYEVQIDLA